MLRRRPLILAQTLHLPRSHQLFVRAQLHAMLRRKPLRTFAHKIHMRTLTQNFLRRPHRIAHPLDAPHSPRPQRRPVHDQRIHLHPAVAVQKTSSPRVKRLVVLHNHDRFLHRIERRPASV